jgi:phenylalanyl-tRNA synthetase alpha chain
MWTREIRVHSSESTDNVHTENSVTGFPLRIPWGVRIAREANMSDAGSQILEGLAALGREFEAQFAAASNEQALRQARAQLLGKSGELTKILKLMPAVPADARREVGERVNAVRTAVEAAFEARLDAINQAARDAELHAAPYDLSLPGRSPLPRGHLHPLMQVKDRVLDIFADLGFQIAWGPEVELEVNNFTKLAFPADHPAMDMQDTFWVSIADSMPDVRALLRTHTSNVQSRVLTAHKPPMAVVSGGRVYRRDDDVTHSPMFHQIEGFLVDKHVSFAELKGVLTAFAQRLYGPDTPVRFRPSYFPFVEPGAEVDVGCVFCKAQDGSRKACRVCKGTGWLEVLGCGMIHPDVFRACDIDPEEFTGFAFGVGVERLTMLQYDIPDIRLLFENDPRFLAQF